MKLFYFLTFLSVFAMTKTETIYDFDVTDIDGKEVSLDQYEGKVLLIVNVASECGFTPQYEELQALYEQYSGKGLEILGFPCNQFGGQEPGSDAEIKQFCTSKFAVSFPMFSKIDVKGDEQAPLYKFLTEKELNGVESSSVKWNFQKYLIGKNGEYIDWYASTTSPTGDKITSAIDAALAK